MNFRPTPLLRAIQCAVLIASGTISSVALAQTYLEKDGVVIFEVEDTNVPAKWIVGTDTEGYTGNAYLEWNGEQRYGAGAADNNKITYRIRITNPGNYQFRWRNRINRGDENTEHNDSFLRLPTGVNIEDEHPLYGWSKVYMNQASRWSWNAGTKDFDFQTIRQYFSAGDHLVEMSGRSPGHAIDRITLYKYDEVNFNGDRFTTMPVSTIVDDGEVTGGGTGGSTGSSTGGSTAGDTGGSTDGGSDGDTGVEPPAENVNSRVIDTPLTPGVCEANRLTLAPAVDLFTQAGQVNNGETLRFDGNQRKTYLQYDLTAVSGITRAELRYTVTTDPGTGEISFDQLAHSEWTAETAADDFPSITTQLATAEGVWTRETRYASDLDVALVEGAASASQALSMKLSMIPASNDVMIAASEHPTEEAPYLALTGDDSFCLQYEQAKQEAENQTDSGDTTAGEGEDTGNETAGETDGTTGDAPTDGSTTAGEGSADGTTDGDTGATTGEINNPFEGTTDGSDAEPESAEDDNDVAAAAVGSFALILLAMAGLRRRKAPTKV